MQEKCITVENVSKSFGNRRVVDGLSFQVKRGEVYGLLGHNGAGKSTTIDMLLGLKTPDQGEARIFGMRASENRKKVFSKVGVQLQQTYYQNGITVEEAEALCDRLCIIRSGRKIIEGRPEEIISKSNQKNLEEAYLFYMDEEVEL